MCIRDRSCAYYLANMGYENVTVFDKNEVPGSMLTLGIPSFRLEKDVVNAEIEVLREMGVHFQCCLLYTSYSPHRG